jgi:hypothetical protein
VAVAYSWQKKKVDFDESRKKKPSSELGNSMWNGGKSPAFPHVFFLREMMVIRGWIVRYRYSLVISGKREEGNV